MAPELLSKRPNGYSNAVDVYAFGIMTAEALLQELPPGLLSLFPVERVRAVHRLFGDVYASCVQGEPNLRPPMAQVADALEKLFVSRYL